MTTCKWPGALPGKPTRWVACPGGNPGVKSSNGSATEGSAGQEAGQSVPSLRTPWQDTISPEWTGWRERAANFNGATVFAVDYQICHRCQLSAARSATRPTNGVNGDGSAATAVGASPAPAAPQCGFAESAARARRSSLELAQQRGDVTFDGADGDEQPDAAGLWTCGGPGPTAKEISTGMSTGTSC
jgi:hypothetical protein